MAGTQGRGRRAGCSRPARATICSRGRTSGDRRAANQPRYRAGDRSHGPRQSFWYARLATLTALGSFKASTRL